MSLECHRRYIFLLVIKFKSGSKQNISFEKKMRNKDILTTPVWILWAKNIFLKI